MQPPGYFIPALGPSELPTRMQHLTDPRHPLLSKTTPRLWGPRFRVYLRTVSTVSSADFPVTECTSTGICTAQLRQLRHPKAEVSPPPAPSSPLSRCLSRKPPHLPAVPPPPGLHGQLGPHQWRYPQPRTPAAGDRSACGEASLQLRLEPPTRWCKPRGPVLPMYIPGRLRTGSRPSKT